MGARNRNTVDCNFFYYSHRHKGCPHFFLILYGVKIATAIAVDAVWEMDTFTFTAFFFNIVTALGFPRMSCVILISIKLSDVSRHFMVASFAAKMPARWG
jgi:hypothetical protein